MNSTSTARTPVQPSRTLTDLPKELQTQIYQYYYPQWPLQIPDDHYQFDEILPQEGVRLNNCGCIPSINLLLICREVNKVAGPIFHDSFTGILRLLLTDDAFADGDMQFRFHKRFHSLLDRVHTLEMDFTGYHGEKYLQELVFDPLKYVRNFKHIVTRDYFVGINAGVLLAKNGFDPNYLENTPSQADLQDKKFRDFCSQVWHERDEATGRAWVLAVLFNMKSEATKTLESIKWTQQFHLEGIPGAIVSIFCAQRDELSW